MNNAVQRVHHVERQDGFIEHKALDYKTKTKNETIDCYYLPAFFLEERAKKIEIRQILAFSAVNTC